jgi:cyclophilin family peptidyl-prolyl cis-trans isomerase
MTFRSTVALAGLWAFLAGLAGCGSGDPGPEPANTSTAARSSGPPSAVEPPQRDSRTDRYDGPDDNTVPGRLARHQEAAYQPQVTLVTSLGEITIKLHRDRAPLTVDNFLEYVTSGFYDGKIFHQVEAGFIVAAGGYTADLKPAATRGAIRNEAHKSAPNRRGAVAMVRVDGIDSATSQFLINLVDNKQLDHKSRELPAKGKPDQYGYCVFGEVVAGWEVVEKIARLKVQASGELPAAPVEPVVIKSARILASAGGGNQVRTARDAKNRYE